MKNLQFCLVVFCTLLLTFSALAQVQNGQFTGIVTDPSGAAIPNAKLTVTNIATALSVSLTTNQSGLFSARELPPGNYKITAEAPGFKTLTNANLVLNAGAVQRVDMKMELGQAKEIVEVTGEAAAVQTEDAKLATTVSSAQIQNLPLNGRNVYDLMQLSAGAVNVTGIMFELGHNTVVNGVREDFNGFLINGTSNKGLSGGVVNTPIQDTVQEFQQLGLNMSAQYGNSAGSTTNLVTKAGTNAIHGSVWEYLRNDAANANEFFLNQKGVPRPPLRWNQFGVTFGGPIVKDKLFYFLSYQGSRFKTVAAPNPIVIESPEWRNAVHQADLGNGNGPGGANGIPTTSVADFLYGKFPPNVTQSSPANTLDEYITGGLSTSGFVSYADFVCPDSYTSLGATSSQAAAIAGRMQALLGVVPAVDNAVSLANTGAPCSAAMAQQNGTVARDPGTGISNLPFQVNSVSLFKSQTGSGANANLFNGNEYSGRIDYAWNAANRLSGNFNWSRETDQTGGCGPSCTRGFHNPTILRFPNGQFSFVHTFTPTLLNEFRAGYSQNVALTDVSAGGVPSVGFDDSSVGFGSYNGYPQFFKENVYSYSDMVSLSHGNHNIKIGVDFRRNIENSVFDVTRPSYYFTDPIFFAADSPYGEAAGVDPNICSPPCSSATIQQLVANGTIPNANLSENKRHWRNLEFGAYYQDDWKATKKLTLQLGLRYDLFTRHSENNNLATTFFPGPGSNLLTGVINANVPTGTVGTINGTTYDCTSAAASAFAQLQGVCGPGGFAASRTLGKGRHKDFGPRVGFAYDVFGNGKTALRGGFGISYEGTLYNPLSNSRWNLPYYSFNSTSNFLGGDVNTVVYGPTSCVAGGGCLPAGGALFPFSGNAGTGAAIAYTGAPTNPNQGTSGAQAAGNIDGWYGQNPNQATLTGIVLPQGIDDPYVYNYYFGAQHEILSKTVLEVDYVGTTAHKLFRAEDINRLAGAALPVGSHITNNIGEVLIGYGGRPNPNYGRLRTWENVTNSNYNSLQASLRRQMSHGFLLNVNYTYSHSIDNGSTWHYGATTANGGAGGDGFTSDPARPGLDRGNSVYDIRHRLVVNHVWQLPGQNLKGVLGQFVGGWSLNGVWSFQTGPHWMPFNDHRASLKEISNPSASCTATDVNTGNCQNLSGDYNLTTSTVGGVGRSVSRPDSSIQNFADFNHDTWANGWCSGGGTVGGAYLGCTTFSQANLPVLTAPCLGCAGDLGRNTFVGPNLWQTDLTLSKNFKMTERFNLKFDAAAFNIFNRTNFELATAATGSSTNNRVNRSNFGRAAGTLGPRLMQFGLKLTF
jgi:hypothetical protein